MTGLVDDWRCQKTVRKCLSIKWLGYLLEDFIVTDEGWSYNEAAQFRTEKVGKLPLAHDFFRVKIE